MSYMPEKEAEFLDRSGNLIEMSNVHKTELGLPADKLAEIQALHTGVKALLVHLEEVFVRNNLQNNDAMTDKMRRAFRVPVHDKKPTHHPIRVLSSRRAATIRLRSSCTSAIRRAGSGQDRPTPPMTSRRRVNADALE